MPTSKNPELDNSFSDAEIWRQEADDLRAILLDAGLSEELKWRKPCYSFDGNNICIIQRMKGFLALLFFKGALLADPDGFLEAQGPNSREGYRLRFNSVQDVAKRANSIKAFVQQAIENELAGLKVEKLADIIFPDELVAKFNQDPDLKAAFDKLTPGRKRGYALHFSAAKQSKTRKARIEKYRHHILNGKGYQERS